MTDIHRLITDALEEREHLRQQLIALVSKGDHEEAAQIRLRQAYVLGRLTGLHLAINTPPLFLDALACDPYWLGQTSQQRRYDVVAFVKSGAAMPTS